MRAPDIFDYLLTKLEGNYSKKCREKIHRNEEAYETYLTQNDIYSPFSLHIFCSPFTFFDQYFNSKFPWNKTEKTSTFTWITPHVTILTTLEAIRTSQDGMADEVSGNIIAELSKRGTFGGFSEERMQLVLEVMWNTVDYYFRDS